MSRTDKPQVIIASTEDDTISWSSDFCGFDEPFDRLYDTAYEIIDLADSVNEAVEKLTAAGYKVVRVDLGEVVEFQEGV